MDIKEFIRSNNKFKEESVRIYKRGGIQYEGKFKELPRYIIGDYVNSRFENGILIIQIVG